MVIKKMNGRRDAAPASFQKRLLFSPRLKHFEIEIRYTTRSAIKFKRWSEKRETKNEKKKGYGEKKEDERKFTASHNFGSLK